MSEITAEWLKAKLADLAQQEQQLIANIHAVAGAKQAYAVALAELEPPAEAPKEPA